MFLQINSYASFIQLEYLLLKRELKLPLKSQEFYFAKGFFSVSWYPLTAKYLLSHQKKTLQQTLHVYVSEP